LNRNAEPFGVYIHWPFCLSKCPYCDFNAHLLDPDLDEEQWLTAYLAELTHYAAETSDRRVSTLFFGGGTPSLMPPRIMSAIVDKIELLWGFSDDAELSMEANPTSVEADKFKAFRGAGINRLSLGIQSFDDKSLKLLGRQHDSKQALDAISLARSIFPRSSFDLIYARPDSSLEDWQKELNFALSLEPEHLSLYQLTIEPGTVYQAAVRRGDFTPLDEDRASEQYEFTQEHMTNAGLPAYEVSNHAIRGAECQHNMIYWRYQDYVGIGPGAHGRFNSGGQKIAARQHRAPSVWVKNVTDKGHATADRDILDEAHMLSEFAMMGLRLSEGIDMNLMQQRWPTTFAEVLTSEKLNWLQEIGCLTIDQQRLKVTDFGRQRLDSVLGSLLS
jgi:putative oxygen-independent coproporphyrinogen III oxidase